LGLPLYKIENKLIIPEIFEYINIFTEKKESLKEKWDKYKVPDKYRIRLS